MKTKAISSIFVLFAIAAGMASMAPAAFADEPQGNPHNIETADTMLAVPGCSDEEIGCYTPNTMTVDVGHTVTMTNADVSAHTFTSGTVENNVGTPDDIFDSGYLMNQGDSFDYLADTAGEFPYYCMLHTWMVGTLVVQEAAAEEAAAAELAAAEEAATDVELMVMISYSEVMGGTQIELEFSELHVNYDMTATQNGEVVFEETGLHSMENIATHQIDAVGSDENPINVKVESLGIGAPGNSDNWTGPVGQVTTAQVVPEFGTIAMMVLAVAIISIVAVTAKSRIVPRF